MDDCSCGWFKLWLIQTYFGLFGFVWAYVGAYSAFVSLLRLIWNLIGWVIQAYLKAYSSLFRLVQSYVKA